MNPSRISTPVNKQIDEWDFKFHQRTVKFRVLLLRNRDPQCCENNPDPWIKFKVEITPADIAEQKLKDFAPFSFEGFDITQLRCRAQKHTESMLALDWKKIIVVGFDNDYLPNRDPEDSERRGDPMVSLSFDYAVGYQSGDFYRYEDYDPAGHYFKRQPGELLGGFRWDKKNIHIFPHDEALLAVLKMLRERYVLLNTEVEKLLKPDRIGELVTNLGRLLPAPKKTG